MKLHALTREEFAGKRWQRHGSYQFAAGQHISPLVLTEMSKAMMALPIALVAQAQAYVPVAVMGLQPGVNWLVRPDGRWLAGYIPAALRSHPFYMARSADGQSVLCFDMDSGLLRDAQSATDTEAFFGEDGKPSAVVSSIVEFLGSVASSQQVTARACAALQSHGLIQPWTIKLATPQGEKTLDGLFRVDEARLGQLGGAELQELVQTGAMGLAYCQLLSMQHLSVLSRFSELQAQWRQAAASAQQQQPAAAGLGLPSTPSGELDLEFLNRGGTLSFGA